MMAKIADIETKWCPGCRRNILLEGWHVHANKPDGLTSWCKGCASENGKGWYEKNTDHRAQVGATYYEQNRDRVIDRTLQRKYGITLTDYHEMLKAQDGVCKLCSQPEKVQEHKTGKVRALAVDHCHESGKVRGLLCNGCNRLIGRVESRGVENVTNYLKGDM
jgi:hypothetical protein